jgi:hypothetical protein
MLGMLLASFALHWWFEDAAPVAVHGCRVVLVDCKIEDGVRQTHVYRFVNSHRHAALKTPRPCLRK